MASYQNTSEYYCGMNMDIYPELYTDLNVYINQNPANYQIHGIAHSPENYENQTMYPVSTPENIVYDPVQGQIIYNNGQYYAPQQIIQYIPLTPEPAPYPMFHLEPRPHYNNQNMLKRHRAQITSTILPSSKGNFKAVVKRKRKRTMFTTEQLEALEDIFKRKQYINRDERQVIVNQLQLNDKAVKIWFQNRRLKSKKEQDSEEQEEISNTEPLDNERSSPVLDRLDSVESQISEKTDEHGFVTLDDGVMGDLVNVIDDFLTKSSVNVPVEEIVGSDSSPVYEPISPASVSDSNEEDNSSAYWRPSEPNESLQRLFDLQSMLSL